MNFSSGIGFVGNKVVSLFPVDNFDTAVHQRCSSTSSCSILRTEIKSNMQIFKLLGRWNIGYYASQVSCTTHVFIKKEPNLYEFSNGKTLTNKQTRFVKKFVKTFYTAITMTNLMFKICSFIQKIFLLA